MEIKTGTTKRVESDLILFPPPSTLFFMGHNYNEFKVSTSDWRWYWSWNLSLNLKVVVELQCSLHFIGKWNFWHFEVKNLLLFYYFCIKIESHQPNKPMNLFCGLFIITTKSFNKQLIIILAFGSICSHWI